MKLRNLSDLLCCILLLIIPSSPLVCAKLKGTGHTKKGRSSCQEGIWCDQKPSALSRAYQSLREHHPFFLANMPCSAKSVIRCYNLSIYSLLLQYVHRWHVGEDDRYSIFTVAYSKSGLTTNNQSRNKSIWGGGVSKKQIKCSPHHGFTLLWPLRQRIETCQTFHSCRKKNGVSNLELLKKQMKKKKKTKHVTIIKWLWQTGFLLHLQV